MTTTYLNISVLLIELLRKQSSLQKLSNPPQTLELNPKSSVAYKLVTISSLCAVLDTFLHREGLKLSRIS